MSTATRVIVLGAEGMLGHLLVDRLTQSDDWEVIPSDWQRLDITEFRNVSDFIHTHQPAWVVNCAAMTQVDCCESAQKETYAVNADAVRNLAEICNTTKSTLLQMSTDYVFDGQSDCPYRENDRPNPLSIYGKSKWLGEQYARSSHRFLIIRTAWLYGPSGKNFVASILAQARAGSPLKVVNDQFGSPSYALDIADGMTRLMEISAQGTYHLVNTGLASWYQLACKAVELAGIRLQIEPVSTFNFASPARRPLYSVLDCSEYTKTTGHHPREWMSALEVHVRNEMLQN